MKRYNQSVRKMLMSLIGTLGAMALAFAAMELDYSLGSLRAASLMSHRDKAVEACLSGVKDFAFERGRTNVVLNGQDPITEDDRRFIRQRREGADRALGDLSAFLAVERADPGVDVARAWNAVKSLREEADRDFARALPARDPSLPGRWMSAANDLMDRLESLLVLLARVPGGDSHLDRINTVRIAAMQFRDLVGKESSTLAASLSSGRPLDADALKDVHQLRGGAGQLWNMLQQDAAFIGDSDFVASLGHIRNVFHDTLRPMQDAILHAAAAGTPVPVSSAEYTRATVHALDSIILSLDSLARAARQYVEDNHDRAYRQVLAGLAAICAAVLLVGLSLWVIARRITRPLDDIVGRIDRLRDPALDAAPGAWKNEFAKVEHALDLLDETLVERERNARALREANRKLVQLADSDELTGLANRRRLNAALADEWARARRNGQPLALLMVDVDHFKSYNDQFGHQAGDERLMDVARVLRGMARRPGDVAARYGGEEFVMLSPGTPPDKALDHAREVRGAVAGLELPHAGSEHGRITVSIGVASLTPTGALRVDDLMRLADNALYEAKRKGRNRVELAGEG